VLYVNGKCDYSSDKNQRENNQSAAVKFTCGKRTFLTCGDAERQEDKALFQLGDKIRADIFKMSHHGYYQAEGGDYTWKFIKKVNPIRRR
jgi:beta-lactamase superfamily II metal-dependent hydrolase